MIGSNEKKKRGRQPGQMVGRHYNVPRRSQITVNIMKSDLDVLDEMALSQETSRSKLVSQIISNFVLKMKGE